MDLVKKCPLVILRQISYYRYQILSVQTTRKPMIAHLWYLKMIETSLLVPGLYFTGKI